MKLSEIFTLKNGSAFKGSALLQEMDEASVRFLRPSKSMYGLLAGYVDESEILERTIIPADSIVVPTNGEGSLAYAVVYPYKAALGMDISALVPKEAYESDMTWGMKQYYAATIRANRFRYCYARKPKGRRLTDLDVPAPEDVPKWAVDATKLDEVGTFSDTPSWVFEQGFDAAYRYILSIDFEEFGKKYGATTNLHGKPVFPPFIEDLHVPTGLLIRGQIWSEPRKSRFGGRRGRHSLCGTLRIQQRGHGPSRPNR